MWEDMLGVCWVGKGEVRCGKRGEKCGTIRGSREMWEEGWCHNLGPQLS